MLAEELWWTGGGSSVVLLVLWAVVKRWSGKSKRKPGSKQPQDSMAGRDSMQGNSPAPRILVLGWGNKVDVHLDGSHSKAVDYQHDDRPKKKKVDEEGDQA